MGWWCLVHCKKQPFLSPGSLMGFVCLFFSFTQILAVAGVNIVTLNGRVFVYSKYLEWCVCSPILSAMTAMSYDASQTEIFDVSVFTFSMVICGLGACLVTQMWIKVFLAIRGSLSAGFVIWELWRISRDPPKKSRVADFYLWMTIFTYPQFLITWALSPDVFSCISARDEFIWETVLSLSLKSIGVLYSLSDEEFDHFVQVPDAIFRVVRGTLINMLYN